MKTADRPELDTEDTDSLSLSSPASKAGCSVATASGLTIVHIALQGCFKSGDIDYDIAEGSGGPIRYLLELAGSLSRRPEVERQIIVTRAFRSEQIAGPSIKLRERITDGVELWRCVGETDRYLSNEELWPELPALTADIENRLCRGGYWPDIVHAHSANAGWIAGQLKVRLGIPFVFTAHSLGLEALEAKKGSHRPSRGGLHQGINGSGLKRRVATETLVFYQADLIVADSQDELVMQFGIHGDGLAKKCTVNPPGCGLAQFLNPISSHLKQFIVTELGRFLTDPDRPPLLALVRPVRKKHLESLVHAFGQSRELREMANLVIWVDNRPDVESSGDDIVEVVRRLLNLVDHYDLVGRVALPNPYQVKKLPAITQWAADRRGLFVNVAFNEPFGFTILEAAAAGLPVVANRCRAARDIIAHCQHGVLVDPEDRPAMISAAVNLLNDPRLYRKLRKNALQRVTRYQWSRHVEQYLSDCNALIRPKVRRRCHQRNSRRSDHGNAMQILVTGLEDTILGSATGVRNFSHWRSGSPDWLWVAATESSVDVALDGLWEADAPLPDYLISAGGTNLCKVIGRNEIVADWQWSERLLTGWERNRCLAALHSLADIAPLAVGQQGHFRLRYRITRKSVGAREIERHLYEQGLHARVTISRPGFLDVLAPGASMGLALQYLVRQRMKKASVIIGAGGNSRYLDLITGADAGIIVGRHPAFDGLASIRHVFRARKPFASGVMEGLHFFTGGSNAEQHGSTPRSQNCLL